MSSFRVCVSSTLRPSTSACKRRQALLLVTCPRRSLSKKAKLDVPEKWQTPGVELPPPEEWWKIFKFPEKRKRKTICNSETAKTLAEALVPSGSKGKVIIEAWPGPGALTRALLALPKQRIKKIILLEEEEKFHAWLKPLQEVDDRIHIMKVDAYYWGAYTQMERAGLLSDVQTLDWNAGVHPQLQYIGQVPANVHGEQLIAQLARAIPDRSWLFKYGRVPLDLTTTSTMAERLLATNTDWKSRCKVGVITQAAAEVAKSYPVERLLPVTNHFFQPTTRAPTSRTVPVVETMVQPIRMIPLETPLIGPGELDIWDFVTRNLFITKATPLAKCITGLGPGAQALLKKLDDPLLPADQRVDISKAPRELTLHDWKILVKVFNDWPFRPENLSIGGTFIDDGRF